MKSFQEKFWNEQRGCLFDVVDVNHQAGEADATLRPNQIFAVGGLPFQLLEGEQARKIVALVEEKLLTPLGLRSLAPGEAEYKPHATVRIIKALCGHGSSGRSSKRGCVCEPTPTLRKAKRGQDFLRRSLPISKKPVSTTSLKSRTPKRPTPRGCPFQAWSVGELLRLDQSVLAETKNGRKRSRELVAA